jgi:hypothetical protein
MRCTSAQFGDRTDHRKDDLMEILIVVLIIALLIGVPAWLRNRRAPD